MKKLLLLSICGLLLKSGVAQAAETASNEFINSAKTQYNLIFLPIVYLNECDILNLNKRSTLLRDLMVPKTEPFSVAMGENHQSGQLVAQLDELRDIETFRYEEESPTRPWSIYAGSQRVINILHPFSGQGGAIAKTWYELIGMDYHTGKMGIGLQFIRGDVRSQPNNHSGKQHTSLYIGRAYFTFLPIPDVRNFFIDSSITFNAVKLKVLRFVTFSGTPFTALSYSHGISWSFNVSAGYDIYFASIFRATPRAVLLYTTTQFGTRVEHGLPSNNILFTGSANVSCRSQVGGSLGAQLQTTNWVYLPEVYLYWIREYDPRPNPFSFVNLTTGATTFGSALAPVQNYCRIGVNCRVVSYKTISLLLNLSRLMNKDIVTNALYAEISSFF